MATHLDSKVKCDVMISYNKKDLEFTCKLAEKFREQGWVVWFADPKMEHRLMLNQKGEAILFRPGPEDDGGEDYWDAGG